MLSDASVILNAVSDLGSIIAFFSVLTGLFMEAAANLPVSWPYRLPRSNLAKELAKLELPRELVGLYPVNFAKPADPSISYLLLFRFLELRMGLCINKSLHEPRLLLLIFN